MIEKYEKIQSALISNSNNNASLNQPEVAAAKNIYDVFAKTKSKILKNWKIWKRKKKN